MYRGGAMGRTYSRFLGELIVKEENLNMSHLRIGSIEVIVGSMFSGKTEELIRLLKRAQLAKQNVQVFKPKIDNRYSADHVASHNRSLFSSTVITRAAEIFQYIRPDTHVIGIDEGQFFDQELVDVANQLAERGLRVVIAGLDLNYKGEPFHPMPELMAIAESVQKLRAVCISCGNLASRTQRVVENDANILVGDDKSYEARCRNCFTLDLEQFNHETSDHEGLEEELLVSDVPTFSINSNTASLDS